MEASGSLCLHSGLQHRIGDPHSCKATRGLCCHCRVRQSTLFASIRTLLTTNSYAAVLVVFVSGNLGSTSAQNESAVQVASAVAPGLAAAIATAVTATTITTTITATSSKASDPLDYSTTSSALSGGTIAGIAIGVVAFIIMVNLMIWLYIVKRVKSLRRSQNG